MKNCPYSFRNLRFLSTEDWGDMVVVQVGENKKDFPVHKGLISHHSHYFDAQLSGRWGSASTIPFNESDDITFQAFYQYIYTHRLVPSAERTVRKDDKTSKLAALTIKDDQTEGTKEDESASSYPYALIQLCQMYVLGNFLMSSDFQAAVMDAICERMAFEWSDPWDQVQYVYENTLEGCGLRRFFADWFAKTFCGVGDDSWSSMFKKKGPTLNHQFLVDVVAVLQGIVHEGWDRKPEFKSEWKTVNKCLYHDHEDVKDDEKDGGTGDEA